MKWILTFFVVFLAMHTQGQNNAIHAELIKLNQDIDQAVVSKDIKFLSDHYADDYVFTHGTGLVDSKASWLKNVSGPNTHFISRVHDSVVVESHLKDINILYGKLTVQRQDKDKLAKYILWYSRVYEKLKGRWQMISHRTVHEFDNQ